MALTKPPMALEDFSDMMNFGVEEEKANNIAEMNFSQMLSFPNHKFKLYEGQQLEDMAQSIKEFGILLPIILWHKDDEYIILSGHNRKNAGVKAGLSKAPVIIKEDLSHEDAVLIVTETNLRQRSFTDLSHSERAYCLAEHYEAMKKQGKRSDILSEIETLLNTDEIKGNTTSSQVETKLRTDEKLGENYGLSHAKVARYIRIATLEKSLMGLLDDGDIAFLTAYTLSFIDDKENQKYIATFAESENYKIDMKKAELLRQYHESKKLTAPAIEEIVSGEKTRKAKSNKPKPVKVKEAVIKKYFTEGETVKEIEEVIEKALDVYFNQSE